MKSRASLRISFCVTASAVERTQGRPIRPICFRRQRNCPGFPVLRTSRPTRCLGPGTRKASATHADQRFRAFSWKGPWSSSQPGALIARLRSGRVLISVLKAERTGRRVWKTSRNSTVYQARFSSAKRSPVSSVRFSSTLRISANIENNLENDGWQGRPASQSCMLCATQVGSPPLSAFTRGLAHGCFKGEMERR